MFLSIFKSEYIHTPIAFSLNLAPLNDNIRDPIFYISESCGPAFEEFCSCIGEKVTLKGFEGYRAQLDNKSKNSAIICDSYCCSVCRSSSNFELYLL